MILQWRTRGAIRTSMSHHHAMATVEANVILANCAKDTILPLPERVEFAMEL